MPLKMPPKNSDSRLANIMNKFFSFHKDVMRKKKRLGVFFLDFLWFLLIVLLLGQIGPILNILAGVWGGGDAVSEIMKGAAKGDLITCSTAILISGFYFMIREYHRREQVISFATAKSLLLLFAIVVGLPSVLLSSRLLSVPGLNTTLQQATHWVVYGCGLFVATLLWLIDELEVTAKEAIDESDQDAAEMTQQSTATLTKSGMKV